MIRPKDRPQWTEVHDGRHKYEELYTYRTYMKTYTGKIVQADAVVFECIKIGCMKRDTFYLY